MTISRVDILCWRGTLGTTKPNGLQDVTCNDVSYNHGVRQVDLVFAHIFFSAEEPLPHKPCKLIPMLQTCLLHHVGPYYGPHNVTKPTSCISFAMTIFLKSRLCWYHTSRAGTAHGCRMNFFLGKITFGRCLFLEYSPIFIFFLVLIFFSFWKKDSPKILAFNFRIIFRWSCPSGTVHHLRLDIPKVVIIT